MYYSMKIFFLSYFKPMKKKEMKQMLAVLLTILFNLNFNAGI